MIVLRKQTAVTRTQYTRPNSPEMISPNVCLKAALDDEGTAEDGTRTWQYIRSAASLGIAEKIIHVDV